MEVGKLGGRAAAAVTAQPGQPGRLALLRDQQDKTDFLVDTGAVYSVLPFSSSEPASGPPITAADGSPIKCWGWTTREIIAAGRRFRWTFLQAAVAFPLVGADFLSHFKLSVDLHGRCLRGPRRLRINCVPPPDGGTFALVGVRPAAPAAVDPPGASCSSPSALHGRLPTPSQRTAVGGAGPAAAATVAALGSPAAYEALLSGFPEVVNDSKRLPKMTHKVQHFIETEGRPVTAKYRRLDPEKLAAAKAEFEELLAQGIVRRSSSSWASPLHMVQKADGTWRPCGDFRRLNLQTKPDLYTCPNIGDLTARLASCTVFS